MKKTSRIADKIIEITSIHKAVHLLCAGYGAEENAIRRIPKSEALPMLIRQICRPADPLMPAKTLTLIDRLTDAAGLYRLGCNMDREAALAAYRGMAGTM